MSTLILKNKRLLLLTLLTFFNGIFIISLIQKKEISYTLQPELIIDNNIIYIVSNNVPTLFYNEDKTKSFQDICKEQKFSYAVNGQYFKLDKSPAGLFILNGDMISSLDTKDKQLSAVVVINNKHNQLEFYPLADFKLENFKSEDITVFQTGPLIIKNNEIQQNVISESINGLGEYKRTLLGYTNSGKSFFIVTTKQFSLQDLAKKILNSKVMKGETISVINLDGGSSTWLYGKDEGIIVEGVTKSLPFVLGFGESK